MIERDIRVDANALDQAAAEVAAVWKAAEAGQPITPTDRLYVTNWEALCVVLTAVKGERRSPNPSPGPSGPGPQAQD